MDPFGGSGPPPGALFFVNKNVNKVLVGFGRGLIRLSIKLNRGSTGRNKAVWLLFGTLWTLWGALGIRRELY